MMKTDQLPSMEAHIGLVLVPAGDAEKFTLTTGIMTRSAMICHADEDGQPLVSACGNIVIAYEGNANGAINLDRFFEKCLCAAGRLATRYPSIAYAHISPEDVKVVATYDMKSYTFMEVTDANAMDAWSGDPARTFLAPLPSMPCNDLDQLKTFFAVPMSAVLQGPVMIFKMQCGSVLVHTPDDGWSLYDPKDSRLKGITQIVNATPDEERRIFGTHLTLH